MEHLIKKINQFKNKVTYGSLGEFVASIEISKIDYQVFINEPLKVGDYGRNIITESPFECVLINWPAGVESSVHHHEGLFGYVLVLEGELDNVSYREENNQLIEYKSDKYIERGIMPEPDGVIHKLANKNINKRAITLHFYYPPIETFEGMRIFNLKTQTIGILSKNAKSAKWSNDPNQFKSITNNGFRYISMDFINKDKSHLIQNIFPKPNSISINTMNSNYFNEQAKKYDFSDFNQPSRKAYINAVDELIAEDLVNSNSLKHLDIATGTGRRAIRIRELSKSNYEIVGVEISKEMCEIANSRGLRTYHQDWANEDNHTGEIFDSATFLYAFGHISSSKYRMKSLNKLNSYLHKDAPLYIDFFSLNNANEWGPLARKTFDENNLNKHGYELGDVFYKKRGFNELAFLHYFQLDEILKLLELTGFRLEWVKNIGYAKNPGKIVNSENEGNFLIKALKV
ncbi:MAG: methyltransferase domain-containing protein [Flavobacteriales bacterium]|nr:methyltransferase domain-containing protein [Flavobacteriales bacterium]